MQMTGARVVCEALLKEDVNVIFGIPGGAILMALPRDQAYFDASRASISTRR